MYARLTCVTTMALLSVVHGFAPRVAARSSSMAPRHSAMRALRGGRLATKMTATATGQNKMSNPEEFLAGIDVRAVTRAARLCPPPPDIDALHARTRDHPSGPAPDTFDLLAHHAQVFIFDCDGVIWKVRRRACVARRGVGERTPATRGDALGTRLPLPGRTSHVPPTTGLPGTHASDVAAAASLRGIASTAARVRAGAQGPHRHAYAVSD
jgi:hypothetical protein